MRQDVRGRSAAELLGAPTQTVAVVLESVPTLRTALTETYRCYVASPLGAKAGSVTVTTVYELAGGVVPATAQTLGLASVDGTGRTLTDNIETTGYLDFTVSLPLGEKAARFTVKATSTSGQFDSDAVDVQPISKVPQFAIAATEDPLANGGTGTGTLLVTILNDPANRVTGVRFTATEGRTTGSAPPIVTTVTAAQHKGGTPYSATVNLVSKVASTIFYEVLWTDFLGSTDEVLDDDTVKFGVGSKPLPPDIRPGISVAGLLFAQIVGDSDADHHKVVYTRNIPDFVTVDRGLGADAVTTPAGQRVARAVFPTPLIGGQQVWIGAISYNKNGVASDLQVVSFTWNAINGVPLPVVVVGVPTIQLYQVIWPVTLDPQCQELYVYAKESPVEPQFAIDVEALVSRPFREYVKDENGVTAGVQFLVSIPLIISSSTQLVTFVAYDVNNRRSIPVLGKAHGIGTPAVVTPGANPPPLPPAGTDPGAPGAPALSVTSVGQTLVGLSIQLVAGGATTVSRILLYVNGQYSSFYDGPWPSGTLLNNLFVNGSPGSTVTIAVAAVSDTGVTGRQSNSLTATFASYSGGGGGGGGSATLTAPGAAYVGATAHAATVDVTLSGSADTIKTYLSGTLLTSTGVTVAAGGKQRITYTDSSYGANWSGQSLPFTFSEVAGGVESPQSAVLTVQMASDTPPPGTGGNGKIPLPSFTLAWSRDQTIAATVTPASGTPPGVTWHIETSDAIGGPYYEDSWAATTNTVVVTDGSQSNVDRVVFVKIRGTLIGYVDGDETAAQSVLIPKTAFGGV